jgi:hypothetical protein
MVHNDTKKGFVDKVSGKLVKYWMDWNCQEWLASSKWGMRVKVEPKTKQ